MNDLGVVLGNRLLVSRKAVAKMLHGGMTPVALTSCRAKDSATPFILNQPRARAALLLIERNSLGWFDFLTP